MSNKIQLQTNNAALDALITRVNAAKDTAASLPAAGGSSNIEYEVIMPYTGNSDAFCYTLPRVTHAIGCVVESLTVADADDAGSIVAVYDNCALYYYYDSAFGGQKITRKLEISDSGSELIKYDSGQIVLSNEEEYHWSNPMYWILINDPSAPAIST